MHNTGYKSALARRACRYSDARPPRKTDGIPPESEIPPHMRGKDASRTDVYVLAGITPAYAGKSSERWQFRTNRRDHPRVCGEKNAAVLPCGLVLGSPPRMRGKVLTPIELLLFHGITLAYAGKSRGPRKGSRCRQDHPRVCGEKEMLAQAGAIWVGSPPHMRGKGFYDRLISPLARITPAYAGKRLTQSRGAVNPSGSPPHMRGKVRQCLTVQFQMGITPAYAGKSMTVWHRNSWGWDHPRICGEKGRQKGRGRL